MFVPRHRRWVLFSSFLCFIGGCSIGSWVTTIFYQIHLDSDANRPHNSLGDYHLSPTGKIAGEEVTDEENSSASELLLAILIMSAPTNFQQRETLRSTWLKLLPATPEAASTSTSTKYYFIIGIADLNLDLKLRLEQENLKQRDLILLNNLHDNFLNLTLKLMQGINFLNTHLAFNYLLKCDDDSFIRIDLIVKELETRRRQMQREDRNSYCYYWGFFDGRAKVLKVGKWQELDYNLCDLYIPYALGGGYILSKQCVQFIVNNQNVLKKFKNEDASVGTWLAVIQPEYKHDIRFDTEFRSRGCNNNYIVQHKITQIEMIERYQNLITNGKLCPREFKQRGSYEYNWNNLPSKCCKRNSSII